MDTVLRPLVDAVRWKDAPPVEFSLQNPSIELVCLAMKTTRREVSQIVGF